MSGTSPWTPSWPSPATHTPRNTTIGTSTASEKAALAGARLTPKQPVLAW